MSVDHEYAVTRSNTGSYCVSKRDYTGLAEGYFTISWRRYFETKEKAIEAAERYVNEDESTSSVKLTPGVQS